MVSFHLGSARLELEGEQRDKPHSLSSTESKNKIEEKDQWQGHDLKPNDSGDRKERFSSLTLSIVR